MMKPYRMLGAALGWFTVIAQYIVNVQQMGLPHATLVYFGFFTMLGNILVAVALAAPVIPGFPGAGFFGRPGVRSAVAVYIIVVEVIFYALLRKVYDPAGFGAFLNVLLHYLMPPLYVLDWLAFTPKRGLRYRQIPYWQIFPIAYAVIIMLRGAVTGYYPYPFLDAGKYGYGPVALNILVLSGFFILLSAGLVTIGRLIAWQSPTAA